MVFVARARRSRRSKTRVKDLGLFLAVGKALPHQEETPVTPYTWPHTLQKMILNGARTNCFPFAELVPPFFEMM